MSTGELSGRLLAVRLDGGIGNTAFQYCYGKAVGATAFINSCWQYGFQLDNFNITLPVHPESMDFTGYEVRQGYWQSEKHFKHIEKEVRDEFTLKCIPNPQAIELSLRMRNSNSVFIHVRRGDYTGPSRNLEMTLPVDYYNRAIDHMRYRLEHPNFFVFSDDIAWVERNIALPRVCTSVHFKPHEDLWLMSQCKHAIIANSSFSWWGAWLNPSTDRQVIYPARWFPSHIGNVVPDKPEGWIAQ